MSKAWENKNRNFETRFKPISNGPELYIKADKKGNPILDEEGRYILIK